MTVLPCFRPTLTAAAVQRQRFNRETNKQKQQVQTTGIYARQVQTKYVGQSIRRSKKILTKK